ncbi:MAG TPA: hypothetical protein VD840_06830 [Sinorhizobium sp.]|nr:hypothetical protein [Sinorhizobium sp.]
MAQAGETGIQRLPIEVPVCCIDPKSELAEAKSCSKLPAAARFAIYTETAAPYSVYQFLQPRKVE